jgi:hypothetical protein
MSMTEDEEYEVTPGTPEQVEVFLDLQRMLVKLYNMWPEDTAIAVYSAACGSVVSLIEAQYAIHVAECENCQSENRPETIDLVSIARSNFDFYYNRGIDQAVKDKTIARDMVHRFFKKDVN